MTIEQASTLQGFPPAWPWQGSRSAAFLQCANAVPPIVGVAALEDLIP